MPESERDRSHDCFTWCWTRYPGRANAIDPDREASPDFQTAFLVGKDEGTVEVIYLGEVDSGKHLVVVLHQAWHRQFSKRKMAGLSRPLMLDVACCTASARDAQ